MLCAVFSAVYHYGTDPSEGSSVYVRSTYGS